MEKLRDLKDLGSAMGVKPERTKDRPPFWDTRSLSIRTDRLLAFICDYQRHLRGQTPSKRLMAHEMEEEEEAVQYWLNRLETDGKIMVAARMPLRIIVKVTPPDLTSARRVDDALKGSRIGWEVTSAAQRFTAAEAQRIRIAHFIGSFNEQNKHGPSLSEIASYVGMSGPGYVMGALEILKRKRIITFNPDEPNSARLTEEGKMALGMTMERPAVPAPPKRVKSSPEVYDQKLSALKKANTVQARKTAEKYERVYRNAVEHARTFGHGPTISHLAEWGGVTEPGAYYIVGKLAEKGLMAKPGQGSRHYIVKDEQGNAISGPKAPQHRREIVNKSARKRASQFDPNEAREKLTAFVHENGRLPYYSDIRGIFGYGAKSSPWPVIEHLEKAGVLRRPGKGKSGLVVLDKEGNEVTGKRGEEVKPTRNVVVHTEKHTPTRRRAPLRKSACAIAPFLDRYIQRWGEAPSYAEIRQGTGVSNVSNVMRYMRNKGWVEGETWRTIKLTEHGRDLFASDEKAEDKAPGTPSVPEREPITQAEADAAVETYLAPQPEPEPEYAEPTRDRIEKAVMPEIRAQDRWQDSVRAMQEAEDRVQRERYAPYVVKAPQRPTRPATEPNLSEVPDRDLAFELMLRGYSVRRG